MKDRAKGVKAWAKALVLAAFVLAPLVTEAGFTSSQAIVKNSRKKLENGTVYTVTSDLEIRASSGFSAFEMDESSIAVLYVEAGKTLTLQGGNASGKIGAGAGIAIPPSSTLIITGGGTIKATGGKGANGTNGDNGEDANVDGSGKPHDDWGRAGLGGKGGDGGGGAGAGIGGKGGAGGNGRDEIRKASNWHDTNGSWECKGYDGWSGYSGSNGGACGTIYVLGTANVTATGGAQGANGGGSGSNGSKDKEYWTLSYRAGGGGGGGGGGSGCAASNFGGGGGGGGAGGGGGEGSRYRTTQGYTYRSANGGHGGGGSGGVSGSGTRTDGEDGWFVGTGGNGGSGGSKGSTGGGGTAYKASAATFSGASSTTAIETHFAIEYTLTFHDGARLDTNMTVKFGYPLPNGPTTHRVGYDFKGWYTNSDGSGTRYYDENGNPVRTVWTDAGDVTLYPRWQENSEGIGKVTLYVNDSPVQEGVDASGDGWNYSSEDGKLYLTGEGGTYNIRGRDEDGFASIRVRAARVTIKVTGELWMGPGSHDAGYMPLVIEKSNARATLEVAEGATCDLTGGTGCPAIWANDAGNNSSFLIKARGALTVTGGDGAADIGPYSGYAGRGGDFYIETYDNWFSNLRLGHGTGDNDGLVNDNGYGAKFFSYPASNRVYCVRLSSLPPDGREVTMYRQRVSEVVTDTFTPDSGGTVWFWVPDGPYEWAEEPNATVSSNNLWVASVEGAHTVADFFAPLHIEIDGEDIAHLSGRGWYTKYEGTTNEHKRASLTITDAGPHVITGYGNANMDIACDTSLTISNLMLNVASWQNKAAMWLANGVTLDLTVEGTNSLVGAPDAPGIAVYSGRTINIGGDGKLTAQGGKNAAGIGGGTYGKVSGEINISGGRITAAGGAHAAGIGGGQTSSRSGDITISGGVVTARGGQYAAAVGGGYTGNANVTITGGTVFPTAGSKASAIGDGYNASGGSTDNKFGFAAIYAAKDNVSPAAANDAGKAVFPVSFNMGLGASCNVTNVIINDEVKTCRDLWTDKSGKLTLWLEPTDGEQRTITITAVDGDGMSVTKSWGYTMDDDGNTEFSTDMLTLDGVPVIGGKSLDGNGWSYNGNSGILTISSGDHDITGNSTNGTINVVVTGDGLNIKLDSLTLMTTKSRQSPFVVSNSCTVTLSGNNTIECICNPNGATANAKGSQYTAAVEVPKGASLVIEGDGTLMANGGIAGAGIGSRGAKSKDGSFDAGSITINGGNIYATGGDTGSVGGGAGIGGGNKGGVESILITGGYVNAKGAKGACGIGMGCDGPLLSDGAFRVTGGTVLAEKGEGSFSDFVTSKGGVITGGGGKSIVIDGGSVRPKNAILYRTNPFPIPANSNGTELVYAMIEGLGSVEAVTISDPLWPQYDGVDIVSDEDGCVCLWGVETNTVRIVQVQSPNIEGGSASFEISASSNTVNMVSGGVAADSRIVNGETRWRVEVHALPAGKRMTVAGAVTNYVNGTVTSDYTGKSYIYLPDGVYDFTFGDPSFSYTYHATVAGAPATATYTVGLLVNGVDVSAESGEGWSYNGTKEALTLNSAREYLLSGTNSERRVSVYAAAHGVKVRNDRLVLTGANAGPFCLTNSNSTLEFTGGTLSSGDVSAPVTVSGGAFYAELENPVSPFGETAYRVAIGTFQSYSLVEIEDIEGLGSYDTSGIYANGSGLVYLYLPNGEYYFRVRNGGGEKEIVVVVDGGDVTAEDFSPTGVYINGRDAARLRGDGWVNRDGLVHLTAATNYVITGTNDGSAVTIKVEKNKTTLTLDNLVMTNELMIASALAVGSGDGKTQVTLELVGTNVLHGIGSGFCGVELAARTELTVKGDGLLVVGGESGAVAIGASNGASDASVLLSSGHVVATGSGGSAAIGGGLGTMSVTNGFLSVSGGIACAYEEKGGTVEADFMSSSVTITGGSLNTPSANLASQAVNGAGVEVYRVTIPTGRPNFDVGAVMSDWHGYLLTGAVTDDEGKLYIWLPNGTYSVNIGRVPFRAVVDNADTEAEQWSVGVEVNGEDVALQSGEGWTYDFNSYKLSVFGDGCTISGSNTTGTAYVQFTNNVSVTISNLVIETTTASTMAPFSVLSNATVALTLGGINSLSCGATSVGGNGYAGMNVPYGSTLSITNLDTVISLPDLDNISVYTYTLYDIELDENGDPVIGADGNVVTNDVIYVEEAVTNYVDTVVPSVLAASGGLNSAGIGGGPYESHGTIEINGGLISATGCFGAGIGSGFFANSGDSAGNATTLRQGEIRIDGGVVAAVGGEYSAGIGGGYNHSGGQITISGGTVVAYGGSNASGIGGGSDAYGHTIKITGGIVEASGGTSGAGIGGGTSGNGSDANTEQCKITISGGQVTATGGTNGAGIGSGYQCSNGASVNITGGTVVASGAPDEYGSTPDDIGVGGYASSATTYPLKIKDASVHALRHTNSSLYMSPAPSNGTYRVWCVTVDTSSTNELVSVRCLDGYTEGTQVYADGDGKIYLWLPNGTYIFAAGNQIFKVTVSGADTTAAKWLAGVTVDGVDVGHVEDDSKKWAYDLGTKTLYVAGDCVISGANSAGYVNILAGLTEEDEGGGTGTVECSFTISNLFLRATSSSKASPITVKEGTVTVCLAGVNRLDATETDSFAGLNVVSPATLVITNLEENARLQAYSGEDAAAIGGNQNKESGVNSTTGTICIRGGIIYAEAQDSGAGIGSGYRGRSGSISISGGRVEAHGGEYHSIGGTWCGAGIGGGDNATVSAECKIAISGGTVEAYGGIRNDSKYAADIGAGYDGNSVYRIEITGGSVHPEADDESRYFNQSESHAAVPLDSGNHLVYKVTLDGFTPNAKVDIELDGYGSNDIYADADGKIYLWLANGTYQYAVGGRRFATKIEGGTVTTVEVPDAYGVAVDGVDVAELVGDVWRYDVFSRQVTVTNACVLSGTNTEGQVSLSVDAADAFAITVSNLNLKVAADATCSPIAVTSGTVTICLVGTNTLDATRTDGFAGLSVASPATLVITNLEERAKLEASGGEYAAGIGGDRSAAVGTIVLSGGIIEANGGNYGAGIGGGHSAKYNDGARIAISGGTIRAKGGWYDSTYHAADIGLGMEPDSGAGNYRIVFSGASTWLVHGSFDETGHDSSIMPVNGAGARVYEATLSGFTPHAKVELEMPNYGTNEIYADSAGTIYLWIANGTYYVNANGSRRALRMDSGTVASRTLPDAYGVKVDGVDVVKLSGEAWNYNPFTDKLTLTADCTLSGTNTYAIEVYVSRSLTVAVDRLSLSARDEGSDLFTGSTLTITNGTSVLLGMVSCDLVIRGGSHLIYSSSIPYVSNGSDMVDPVRLGGFEPYAPVAIEGPRNYDYGTSNIFADGSGNVYLWLPEGVFDIKINGVRYILTVEIYGNGTLDRAVGVEVDGMDVANGSGAGWSYDRGTSTLTITGDVTLSGTNTAGEVKLVAYADVTVSPSRLVLGVGSGEDVFSGSGTVTITNGTAQLTGNVACPLKILGGSFKFDGLASVAVSNETAALFCVEVPGLTPDAAVAFSGLPPYYGTSGIYADADGKVYLWLPLEWNTSSITPQYLSAPTHQTLKPLNLHTFTLSNSQTPSTHTFAANGYSYTVTIDPEVGGAVATRGAALELEGLKIIDFQVGADRICLRVKAKPETWLNGFVDSLVIRASATLPIPASNESILDLSGGNLELESDGTAVFTVPLDPNGGYRFFTVEKSVPPQTP